MPRIITKKCFNDLIFTSILLCTSHRTVASGPEKFKAMHPDSRTTSVTSPAHLSRSNGDSGWPTLYLLELRYFIAPLRGDFKHRLAGIEIPLINREANSGVLEIDMACKCPVTQSYPLTWMLQRKRSVEVQDLPEAA